MHIPKVHPHAFCLSDPPTRPPRRRFQYQSRGHEDRVQRIAELGVTLRPENSATRGTKVGNGSAKGKKRGINGGRGGEREWRLSGRSRGHGPMGLSSILGVQRRSRSETREKERVIGRTGWREKKMYRVADEKKERSSSRVSGRCEDSTRVRVRRQRRRGPRVDSQQPRESRQALVRDMESFAK